RQRVQRPRPPAASRQADVEMRARQLCMACRSTERVEPRAERGLNLVFELVRALAELAPPIARQLGHPLHQARELAVRSDEARVRGAQRRLIARGVEQRAIVRCARREARFEGGDLIHGSTSTRGGVDDGLEATRVADRELREDLAVELNTGLLQPADQLAVAD